jgi:hypothetical protein
MAPKISYSPTTINPRVSKLNVVINVVQERIDPKFGIEPLKVEYIST